jgi:hypothetical protein
MAFATEEPIFPQLLMFAVTLMTAAMWSPPQAATTESRQGQSRWLRTESQHFEIHYLPTLARDVERVVRSAERAYDHISGRLDFVFAKKVPLVMSATTDPLTRDEIVAYSVSDEVAPQQPHRSRLVLPVPERDADLDALIVHELTHLLVCEIILPEQSGDGGLPRWVHEGIANYMVGTWSDDHERLMRNLAAAGNVPSLSQLSGSGGFSDERLNDALGHAAFDYIERRWGRSSIRRFVNALIVPRVDKTYDAVFGLTPAEFDGAFRNYVERRFKPVAR